VSHDGKFEINPDPRRRLERGSAMVVIGCNKDINRLPIYFFWLLAKSASHRRRNKAIVRSDRFDTPATAADLSKH